MIASDASTIAEETPSSKDGTRVLVYRLWSKGVSKERIKVGEWMRGIRPFKELIKWFGHEPKKWEEFEKRYKSILEKTHPL